MPVLENYITREQLAKELNVHERTILRWEIRRIGPPRTQVGRLILYSRDSIRAWLASREQRRKESRSH